MGETMTVLERAKASNQCKHLMAELDPYDDWYMVCELGETASERKCQKSLRNCGYFERISL